MNKTNIAVLGLAMLIAGTGITSAYNGFDRLEGQQLTDGQKSAIEGIRDLMRDGKIDEAQTLAEESGLPHFAGNRMGMGKGMMRENPDRDAVREAVENNDYATFVELRKNMPFAEDVSEETFAKMVEAHKLMLAGDRDSAFEIMKEIAPEKGTGFGNGHFGGMGRGFERVSE
jgi:hypothetical protein